ncbi:anaerobic ribonucleoside-triphosphate reductase activating protein [Clostridium sp.]|uniref:anaerobic ribonucleoside-triphosphate reductase activating protein n=1 Tax=Clostridium sp. TaxID=1506 RepID=UPI001DF87591|nr:anaerobic ribonucleoside-triphosphate reductase activating protein [Clostridium sp.]MBS5307832.1 anaerobic ribonucleoside-triphosphate reductase activating protein [Clostridium sp.]
MNYAEIKKFDIANAPKVCCTIFFSGCTHNCKGCFNKEVQNFNYGKEFSNEVMNYFISKASHKQIKNICILGGEPFQQEIDIMINFLERLKIEVKKPIWVWTGYLYEELLKDRNKNRLLKYIDVLIDGRFELDKKDLNLRFRGSSNQRIIDVQKSLKQNKIIEFLY